MHSSCHCVGGWLYFNPLIARCSCDAMIGGCRQNGLLVPCSPFSRHPPIKTLFGTGNLSLVHLTQNIKSSMNPFCAKNVTTNYTVVPYGNHGTERVKDLPYCQNSGWRMLYLTSPRSVGPMAQTNCSQLVS